MTALVDDRMALTAILRAWAVVAQNVPEVEAAIAEVDRRAELYRANAIRYARAGRNVTTTEDDPYLLVQAVESVAEDMKAGRLV